MAKATDLIGDLKKDPRTKDLVSLRTAFSPVERQALSAAKRIISQQEYEIAVLKEALLIQDRLSDVQSSKRSVKKKDNKKTNKAYQLHLSDTHSREIVTLADTNGQNEHNAEIGAARFDSVIRQAERLVKADARTCNPVHFTIWGGGDWMVNADLHYKMERCVDEEPLVEMEHVYELISSGVRHLVKNNPCDTMSFVGSFSNHGRDTIKMVPGLEAARSYDTAIYRRMEKDFSCQGIEFTIADTPWTVEEVAGFRTMYTHGHPSKANVKRNSDGIMVPKWSFVRDMRIQHNVQAWVQGHHHVNCVLWSNEFCHMQNSSLVGTNGYSNSEAYPPCPPSQNLAVIDLDRGVVEKVIAIYP